MVGERGYVPRPSDAELRSRKGISSQQMYEWKTTNEPPSDSSLLPEHIASFFAQFPPKTFLYTAKTVLGLTGRSANNKTDMQLLDECAEQLGLRRTPNNTLYVGAEYVLLLCQCLQVKPKDARISTVPAEYDFVEDEGTFYTPSGRFLVSGSGEDISVAEARGRKGK